MVEREPKNLSGKLKAFRLGAVLLAGVALTDCAPSSTQDNSPKTSEVPGLVIGMQDGPFLKYEDTRSWPVINVPRDDKLHKVDGAEIPDIPGLTNMWVAADKDLPLLSAAMVWDAKNLPKGTDPNQFYFEHKTQPDSNTSTDVEDKQAQNLTRDQIEGFANRILPQLNQVLNQPTSSNPETGYIVANSFRNTTTFLGIAYNPENILSLKAPNHLSFLRRKFRFT